MASVSRDPNGTRRILFTAPDGTRKAIRLGKVSQRAADGIKYRVEQLLEALLLKQALPADLAQWVADLDSRMAGKLSAVGLINKPEAKDAAILGAFLTAYIAGRTDVKPSTTRHFHEAARSLIGHFGEDKPLAEITPGDADEFRRKLTARLGDNTLRRQCGRAKQFFRAALRKRLIPENPFSDMKGVSVQANPDRQYFVSRADTTKIIDACPDHDWRLIVALSRYGGLRCPSEHLAMRWADINWERGTMLVHAPKTEHHEGKATRVVPIFPELRGILDEAWEKAEDGAEHVITRYRDATQNLRTTFMKIIKRAGLTPWPKLFQNLRASRATELAAEHPAHVAAAWLGHSTIVATKHYWQVTDADIAKAIRPPETASPKAAQKAAQPVHATGSFGSHAIPPAHEKTPVLPGFAAPCDLVQMRTVPPQGLEP